MPRDPKRIEYVLDVIREIWERYPDLRLCQLLGNTIDLCHPMFYCMEDDELVRRLKSTYAERN